MPSFNNYKHVFKPLKLKATTLKNRIEFSPMVCDFTDCNGEATEQYISFVELQASTGVALIHLGATPVDHRTGADYPRELDVTDDLKSASLSRLAESAHIHEAKLSCELVHAGRGADPKLLQEPWALAPSVFPIEGEGQAAYIREMDQKDIDHIIDCYVDCALRLQRCDFDGVLIHGAHGNLIGQFLSPLTNTRHDLYGGSFENRCRFPLKLLKAVRQAVGDSFIVELRISGDECVEGGCKIDEVVEFLKKAQEYTDLVTVSAGMIVDHSAQFYCMPPYFRPHAANVPYSRRIRQCPDIKIPVSVVGSIHTMELADEIIDEGSADMVAIARALLCDPELIKKSYCGKSDTVRPCLRCWNCSTGSHIKCAMNPALGAMPKYSEVHPAPVKKNVVVIGGGAAGCTAAMTLIKRGHHVVLFEKENQLGGLLNDINKLPFKEDMLRYTQWLQRTTLSCGADIRLGAEATPELIMKENPDAIVIAVGSSPVKPNIPGIDASNVYSVLDVDSGRVEVKGQIVVCGGGISGCESALALAMNGCEVTVIDMLPVEKFAEGMADITRNQLMALLKEHGVRLVGEHLVRFIDHEGVHADGRNWSQDIYAADFIVDAFGMKSNKAVAEKFTELIPETYVTGDCNFVKNLDSAIHAAYYAACNI